MAEEKKTPRLGKAAREFNVSTARIVELLSKKGQILEDNTNSKLTIEMYDILIEEFQGEKIVKEEAKKIDIDYANTKKDEPEKDETAVFEEELLIKNVNVIDKPEPHNIERKTPKIVGKVDLDAMKPKKKKENTVTKDVPKKKKDNIEKSAQTKKIDEVAKPAVQESSVKISKEKQIKEKELIRTEMPILESQIKIVDKIDLSTINSKTRPAQKTEAELKKEKEERKQNEKIIQQHQLEKETKQQVQSQVKTEEKPKEPEKEFIKTNIEKLQGPKIMGKIELAEKKEPAASKTIEDHKKKRKRLKTPPSDAPKSNFSHDKNRKHKPVQKEVKKVEISNEDIQHQIKATLSRLEPVGKNKAAKHRREKRIERMEERELMEMKAQEEKSILKVTEFITANELATMMNIPVTQIISTCMSVGIFVAINQRLSAETISLLADEFHYKVEFVDVEEHSDREEEEYGKDIEPRTPIITIMGHVDHGKTSLLDYIRKTNVIAGEAGGITQHIGAYEVSLQNGRKITFLDTPGHEAFTAMRARGAKITDICIIVIAADDAIMPQTIEAINHAQAAGVPMIFAINKIDKPNAHPDKIREGLANMNILVEEWGGKYQCQEISAKKGINVNELLEKVLLEADMLELKANPDRPALGTVIESALDKGRGYVAKVLVQNGTLKIGDVVLAGMAFGKVKAMFNERNIAVKQAKPSVPVLLLGLNSAPQAGDTFKVYDTEQEARSIANKRQQLVREQGIRTQKHVTLDDLGRRIALGNFKELNIIVKGDVDGSIEALSDSLLKLSTEQVQVNVIHKSVGAVTESDVLLASASEAIIVAFQVRPTSASKKLAEQEQIDIRTYSVIYDAIAEIKDAIEGMLAPEVKEKVVANLEVRETFRISKVGTIAGCMVLDGKISRQNKVRIIRDGIVIFTGRLGSLKRFKDDVKEVTSGYECGLNIESFNDIREKDIIESFEEYEVKATL